MNTDLSLELFEELFDKLPNSNFILNIESVKNIENTKIFSFNTSAKNNFNIDSKIENQLLGKYLPKLFDSVLQLEFQKVIKTKANGRIISYHFNKDLEGEKFFRIEIIYLKNNFLGLIFYDITCQKELQIQLDSKLDELEKLNRFMIDRELNMIKLKEEVQELKNN